MVEKRYPMTPAGKKAIEERLRYLKTVERPQNIKAIEVARGHGDLFPKTLTTMQQKITKVF